MNIARFILWENNREDAMKYTILVIDDEVMITDLLKDHLEDHDYLVFTANNAEDGMDLLSSQPHLILLDINMPGMNGLDLCKNIRNHVTCPIIFLTARISELDKVNGLQVGGDDYMTKPFSLVELTARISAHLRREERTKRNAELIYSHGLIVNLLERTVFYNETEIILSKIEFDLLEFLMRNANQVFDRERIYDAVWGFDAVGDSKVVKEHISKIRAKLQGVTGQNYIETVWGVGYRWLH